MTLYIGPNLFIDDYLIAESRGLTRTTHQPEKLPDPVLDHDRPVPYMKVLYDDTINRYRMWYNAMAPKHGVAYAESQDGIKWVMPDLGLSVENYIDAPFGHWGFTLIDEGPGYDEEKRRYKMAWYEGRGMCVAFSSDGLRFRPHDANPVIPTTLPDSDENVISDIVDIAYDPLRGVYLLGCKLWRGGYPGTPKHASEGMRRTVGVSTSKDFVNWAKPTEIVTSDPNNGQEEFYGFKPKIRGNLYIGFLRVLRDDLPATPGGPVEGIGWTELLSSRDGRKWTRHQEPFIDRDSREGRWDHAMAWFGDIITVDGKEYVYYGGYRAGHKIRAQRGDRSIGMGVLRMNGFVSRDADTDGGFLKTPPAVLPGNLPTVNAVVRGEIRVRLVDTNGEVLPGFDWADCVALQGDSLAHRVKWRENAFVPKGKVVSLEFMMNDVELYGFDFAD